MYQAGWGGLRRAVSRWCGRAGSGWGRREEQLVVSEESVADLVRAAVSGDEQAWDALVERYSPLLMSVLRRYRMSPDDLRDVAQTVWLRLIENLGNLREPRALPSWIITTARNESLRVLKAGTKSRPFSSLFEGEPPLPANDAPLDGDLLLNERRVALLEAFAELGDR